MSVATVNVAAPPGGSPNPTAFTRSINRELVSEVIRREALEALEDLGEHTGPHVANVLARIDDPDFDVRLLVWAELRSRVMKMKDDLINSD